MPTTIGELIGTLKGTRTYDQLAQDCGGIPTSGRIQQLATKPQNTFPSPDTVRGLAQGLRTSSMAVISACAASLGLKDNAPQPRINTMLPEGAETLDDSQLAAVLAVIQQFAACNLNHAPKPEK